MGALTSARNRDCNTEISGSQINAVHVKLTQRWQRWAALFNRDREDMTGSLWKCENVGKQQGRDKERRRAVPVPDQKGEEEGGTKPQPPGGTTEKCGE